MTGLTLDTGALVALERRDRRAMQIVAAARERGDVTVPTAVIVEWWRGQRGPCASLLRSLHVEPLTHAVALVAGEALKGLRGPSPTDAVVMASAARRGDVVLTSDVADLERLRAIFPGVRLLRV